MNIIGLFFNPTERVIGTITVEHDHIELLGNLHDGRKIGINFSKLGSYG